MHKIYKLWVCNSSSKQSHKRVTDTDPKCYMDLRTVSLQGLMLAVVYFYTCSMCTFIKIHWRVQRYT